MSNWQPIETAPKDGSYILATPCFGTSTQIYQIYFDNRKKVNKWKYGRLNLTANPTHWMPLPPPPKSEE
jgi:hypothetical protein